MKNHKYIKTQANAESHRKSMKCSFLACGACVLLLGGCSWLESWPYANGDMDSAQQQQTPVVQNGNGTWVNETVSDTRSESPLFDETAQTVALHNNNGQPMMQPRGVGIDSASASRLSELEIEIQNLRSEINMIMPALTKLAEAQGSLTQVVSSIEPAAGGPVQNVSAAMSSNFDENAIPKDATWYEIQAMQQQQEPPQSAKTQPVALQQMGGQKDVMPRSASVTPEHNASQNFENMSAQQAGTNQAAAHSSSHVAPGSQAAAYLEAQGVSVNAHNELQNTLYDGAKEETMMNAPMQVASYQVPAASVVPSLPADFNQFVRGIRFGEHHDKTRMVLDSNQDVSFSYNVDPSGQVVVIDMPVTGWKGANQMAINAPLVASYNVEALPDGGSRLILNMREPVKVLWAQALRPSGTQGHRIVFDIAPI